MLSNLNGLCELYRVTGERPYLEAAQNAWFNVIPRGQLPRAAAQPAGKKM